MNKIILTLAFLLTAFSTRLYGACNTPVVTTPNVTINSLIANWSGVPTAVNFEYILDQDPATPIVPGTATTNANQPFTGLTPATTYYVHARANCGVANGFSAWVTVPVTTLSLPPCNAPAGLNAYGFTSVSANITWMAVPGAASYQFVLNQNPATPFIQGIPTASTYYNAAGLLPGTTYYFHLRTDCSAYMGDTSAWEAIQFTTPSLPSCNAPTGIAATNITSTGADVSWNPQTGILGWEFVLNQSPADPYSGTFSTSNAIALTGLVSFNTYFLHLRTDCGAYPGDTSHWVTYAFITLPDSCTNVSGIQINFVTPYTAFGSWNASPGAYAYEYLLNEDPAPPQVGGSPTFSTYSEVQFIEANTTYYLHVRSVCDTAYYTNNYTSWVTDSFSTTSGLNVSNTGGNDKFTIAAYPNPVQKMTEINLSGIQKGNSSFVLMDIIGKHVQTIAVDGRDKVTIDMDGLATGMYLLRYTDNEQVYTLRLNKQ